MVGKFLNCVKSSLAVLIDLLSQTKPSTLPTVDSIVTPIHGINTYSDKAAEFIDLIHCQAFVLGWSSGSCPAARKSQRETSI